MPSEAGESLKIEAVNLAEMERRMGISRSCLCRLKKNGYQFQPYASKGRKARKTVLSDFTGALDDLLRKSVSKAVAQAEKVNFSSAMSDIIDEVGRCEFDKADTRCSPRW